MTDRYHLDSYTQRAKKDRPNPKTYYALFDRNGNFGEPLAKTMSADPAQRIVDLLNADEDRRAGAKRRVMAFLPEDPSEKRA